MENKNFLWRTYTKSPINFSTITGLRYPGIPRLKGNPFFGKLNKMFQENGILENVIEAGREAANHPSGMCYFWVGTQLILLLTRPDDIYQIKIKNARHLSTDLPLLESFGGSNIFTDGWDLWREKKHTCQEAIYNETALTALEPGMQKVIDHYVYQLQYNENKSIELRTFFSNLIVDVVSANLLGSQNKSFELYQEDSILYHLTEQADYSANVMRDVLEFRNLFKWMLPSVIRKIFFKNEITDFELLKKEKKSDFFRLFIEPNEKDILAGDTLLKKIWDINHQQMGHEKKCNYEEIFGDGIVLLSAGVATTIATLEFIIKLLAAHPDKLNLLQRELDHHLQDKPITIETLEPITYLDNVIKETLRLYPPAPLSVPREIATYTEVNQIPLFKGDVPIISAYVTHRLTDIWQEPELFKPERFNKEEEMKRPKTSYMPFGVGPRACVGQLFAFQEMKLILAKIYKDYDVVIDNNSFAITLKQGGLAPKIPPVGKFVKRVLKGNSSNF